MTADSSFGKRPLSVSLMTVFLFLSDTIFVRDASFYALCGAGGDAALYQLFGMCCGIFDCFADSLVRIAKRLDAHDSAGGVARGLASPPRGTEEAYRMTRISGRWQDEFVVKM